jgi:hypothetical protein
VDRRDGWYGRFVESGAYPLAIDLFAAAGFAFVLAVLGMPRFERTAGALIGRSPTLVSIRSRDAFLTTLARA